MGIRKAFTQRIIENPKTSVGIGVTTLAAAGAAVTGAFGLPAVAGGLGVTAAVIGGGTALGGLSRTKRLDELEEPLLSAPQQRQATQQQQAAPGVNARPYEPPTLPPVSSPRTTPGEQEARQTTPVAPVPTPQRPPNPLLSAPQQQQATQQQQAAPGVKPPILPPVSSLRTTPGEQEARQTTPMAPVPTPERPTNFLDPL